MHKIKLLFLFWPLFTWSQVINFENIRGILVYEKADLESIYIYNVNTQKATISEKFGTFTIPAKIGDTIIVSALQFEKERYVITPKDFEKKAIRIELKIQNIRLNEVQINQYQQINSKSLGLIPANQKTYTPAERKLKAAGELHWYSPLLIPFGGMSFDGLVNAISGRTKQLKKEVEVEKREMALEKISFYYQDTYFTDVLKIPTEKVEGFKFYLVEDGAFVNALKNKNKNLANFLIVEIAEEYKKINKE